MKKVLGWHFAPADNKLTNGDGRKIVRGRTLHVEGEIVPCGHGLHASASVLDALQYAQGPMLWRVELSGTIVPHGDPVDKHAASDRKAVAGGKDASALLWLFARQCALDVVHLWDAPQVVREFLETGNESKRGAAWAAAQDAARGRRSERRSERPLGTPLRTPLGDAARNAARNAARDAARDAAWDAARGAAWNAARDAAWGAQRKRFEEWALRFVDDGTLPGIILERTKEAS